MEAYDPYARLDQYEGKEAALALFNEAGPKLTKLAESKKLLARYTAEQQQREWLDAHRWQSEAEP